MRKIVGFIVIFLWVSHSSAQYNGQAPWMISQDQKKQDKSKNQELTLNEISLSFNTYWQGKDFKAKGSGFKPFKRWEDYWRHATDQNGYLPSSVDLWKAFEDHVNFKNANGQDESNWEPIGPNTILNHKSSTANIGRVNIIVPDPNNEDILFVGTPAGGIWKSIDKGVSWNPLSDNLPQIGVSGIAIDPSDSSIIYIATGDDDNFDTSSAGVFKSTDGGENWNQTGLNPENTPSSMNDIYIHPNDSNILYVATNNGLYRTEDAGDNWTRVLNGNIYDIKLKPGSPNTIYAVTSNKFYKSVDGGGSFNLIETGLPADSGRLVLDVTPANSNYLYILSAVTDYTFQGLYKSTDSGETFTKTLEANNIFESDQAWFDLALAVSSVDPNEVYVGCLNIWKSTNGGDSFSRLNNWVQHNASFTHADIHYLRFFNDELFAGTDGGFYKSEDGGTTFQDFTQGLQISQFYKVSVAKYDASKIVGGTQDNGGMGLTNTEAWNNYHGGDGMDNAINPLNVNQYFGFTQLGGTLNISNDAGLSSHGSYEGPEEGNWITPMIANKEGELYAGYSFVYRFTGTGFEKVSSEFEALIDVLSVDNLDVDLMYAGVGKKFFRSSDRAINFEETHAFAANINSIEVHSENSDIIYATTSGFGTRGVYRSTDRGQNFEEITFNLPADQPYFDVVHQGRNSLNPIYVGTSLGVYRLDDSVDEWQSFNTGLPNVPVRDLEISIEDAKLIAATYGRGIWRSDITIEIPEVELRLVAINSPNINFVNCGDSFSLEIEVENKGSSIIESVDIVYTIDGVEANFEWIGTINVDAIQVISVENLNAEFGIQKLEVTVNAPNDSYDDNNSLQTNFLMNKMGIPNNVNDFEGDNELLSYNEGEVLQSIWERGAPTGTLLNTAASGNKVYGTNLDGVHADLTKGFIYSECYDLSATISPMFEFKMAYDLEENWDIIYIEYSVNNGENWQVLGTSSDPNWYNSNRTNETSGNADDCQNCPGAQWTGTNATLTQYSYDLAALASEPNVVFRFVFHSDPFEHQEGVVIDDFVISKELIDDEDDDDDGILDVDDNCPLTVNVDQADLDEDGIGDVCDDDIDGDGILDFDDNCPMMSNEDQADFDEDGIGDVCDEDMDGDGILNVDDNCPTMSNVDQADLDEDGIGDSCDEDIDGDGIIDLEDNCPAISNADQADLDEDGIGDICDEDIDGDGILNTDDACNNTPLNGEIDETGCSTFSLPINNFRLEIHGETCRTSNNGSLLLTAVENLNYTAAINGNETSDSKEFTAEGASFNDLKAGVYEVCITVESEATYKSCFDIVISEPEKLSVASKIDTKLKTLEVNLDGGMSYEVNLNGKSMITDESFVNLNLRPGINKLKVSTDVLCQGTYEETIIIPFDGAVLYPNPVKRGEPLFLITADIDNPELEIAVYTESGSKLISGTFNNPVEKRVEIDVKYLPRGVYFLYVGADEVQKSYTFIIE